MAPRPTFASTSEAISTLPSQGDFRSKEYRHLHYPGCNINRRGSATLSPAPSIAHSSTGSSSYSTTKRSKMSILQHPQPSASKSAQQQFENKNKQIGSNGSVVAQHYVCDVAKIPIVTPRPSSTALPVTTNGKQIGSPKLPPVITQDMRNRTNLPDELPIVKCIARARIPTTQGPDIFLHLYENNVDNKEHLAIVFGENIRSRSLFKQRPGETQQDRMTRGAYIGKLSPGRTLADTDGENTLEFNSDGDLIVNNLTFQEPTLVRIHSECYTGETAWSARCDCGEQFDQAGKIMGENGHGCMVYLRQEGRGIGLGEKLKAYNLQDLGADTVEANLLLRHPADARNFSLATAILLDLGLVEIKLLTNNPDKIIAVEGKHQEVKVKERIPMIPLSWSYTNDESESNGSLVKAKGIKSKEIDGYLSTKIERMGHLLEKPIKINSQ
ncbi:GTP cyclohydrolase II [Lodderomyces elongisporus]|uniref:GTP cyclohydrolase II n=1 Tax=Lodderomyces elongisporus TaxID=36914 RepID=UPI002922A94C|nr:GTP cyclohydrolase II [Lodderomyces elongisporus]WLF76517.1 GTP cyclohydrolase II [Lodderomyces elongisporus]